MKAFWLPKKGKVSPTAWANDGEIPQEKVFTHRKLKETVQRIGHHTGVVAEYAFDEHYGFIRFEVDSREDVVFFRRDDLVSRKDAYLLKPGDRVEFKIAPVNRVEPPELAEAADVKPIGIRDEARNRPNAAYIATHKIFSGFKGK